MMASSPTKKNNNSVIQLIESRGAVRSTSIIRAIIHDLAKEVTSPAQASLVLKECASAAMRYKTDLSWIIQTVSNDQDSPLFYIIIRTNVDDEASLEILSLFMKYTAFLKDDVLQITKVRRACMIADDQRLFDFIRNLVQYKEFAPSANADQVYLSKTGARDRVVIQPRVTDPERLSNSHRNQSAFTAEFIIPMFQMRMRGLGRVEIEFIAQGRMWCLAFRKAQVVVETPVIQAVKKSRLPWRRDRKNNVGPEVTVTVYNQWQVSLSMTDSSDSTPVQALLTLSPTARSATVRENAGRGDFQNLEVELMTKPGERLVSKEMVRELRSSTGAKVTRSEGCTGQIAAPLDDGILSSSGSLYIEEDGSLVGLLEAILTMAESESTKEKAASKLQYAGTQADPSTDTVSVCH